MDNFENKDKVAPPLIEEPVAPNMSLNEADRMWIQEAIQSAFAQEQKHKRQVTSFGKKLMKYTLTPAKKLAGEDNEASDNILALFCNLTAYLGYLTSIGIVGAAVAALIKIPSLTTLSLFATALIASIFIMIAGKFIEVSNMGDNDDKKITLISTALFWFAYLSVVLDFVSKIAAFIK